MSEFPSTEFPFLGGTASGWGGGHGIAAAAKYNPHLWSAAELRAIFVVRQRELSTILDAIRAVAPGEVPQHMLITGQRGMGKSTLLQRVALAVNEEGDVDLAKNWLALRFPEEQYTVSTPAELWINVIGALADTLERAGLPFEAIDIQMAQLGEMPMAQREEAALAWLQQWCSEHQKRLLLLMDSTDLLFSNLAGAAKQRGGVQDGGASALWRVRKVLQHSPHFFWLGGSYQPLEVNGLYSDAFLDFFQLIELRPLSLVEMQTAILALAHTFGAGRGLRGDAAQSEVKRMLESRPERLRAMRQLTGGIPRTTIILYELFAAGGQESVRSDLERLLDMMTPLYKARLEILADQPRKVLAHVMESWAPITAKGLADVAGLAVGTVSTQLGRLELEGLVEKTALSGTKRQGYQVSERFFNIWYLMRSASRNARARVGWLVEFMRLWYSKDELQGIAKIRWLEHRDGVHCGFEELEYSRAIARAMPKAEQERRQLDWAVYLHARKEASVADLFDLQGEDAEFSTPDDYLDRLDKLRTGLRAVPLEEPEKSACVNEMLGSVWMTLAQKEAWGMVYVQTSTELVVIANFFRKAIFEARDLFLRVYGQIDVEKIEAAVMNGDFFPDCPDPQLALTQIETCFGSLPLAFSMAVELLAMRHNDSVVAEACERAIELAPTSWHSWFVWANFCEKNNRYQEAEKACRKAIEFAPAIPHLWNVLGKLLQNKLKRHKDAEDAYRNGIECANENVSLHANLAWLLVETKRNEEASQEYRLVLKMAGETNHALRLQACCWLGDDVPALQALDALAEKASLNKAKGRSFSLFKEQCYEINAIGLGKKLAELMARSTYAGFLQPFALALRAANGEPDALLDVAVEVRGLAEEILLQINNQRN